MEPGLSGKWSWRGCCISENHELAVKHRNFTTIVPFQTYDWQEFEIIVPPFWIYHNHSHEKCFVLAYEKVFYANGTGQNDIFSKSTSKIGNFSIMLLNIDVELCWLNKGLFGERERNRTI